MKSCYKWLFAGLVLYAILITWTAVDKNEYAVSRETELKRQQRELIKRDGQIRELLDSLHKQDLAALKWIQAEKIRADRAEEKADKIQRQYESIRRFSTKSDSERDSVLTAILSN